MNRRERLMATLQGCPVDRPAVNFYEIGGFNADPNDPDDFNIYNDPSWKPLLDMAETETDLIRMRSPNTTPSKASRYDEFFSTKTWIEGKSRFSRTTVKAGKRILTSTSRRDAELDTTWQVEHLIKDIDDLKAYLEIPQCIHDHEYDVSNLFEDEKKLGDKGIVMVDTGDPICSAASLFDMETYTVIAFTEQKLFRKLLDSLAPAHMARTEKIAKDFPGRLWRICGSEYASEPYLSPDLYREYVVKYTGPMVKTIRKYGGYPRIHSHGRLKNILPLIIEMGPVGLDPVEPPPQGDVELDWIVSEYGKDLVIFGNLEITDIENVEPAKFAKVVEKSLRDGTGPNSKGFVLMPSSCPYGRKIPETTLANYRTMVEQAVNFRR